MTPTVPGAVQAARWLVDQGLRPGDRLGLGLSSGPLAAAVIQGAWQAGIAVVPCNRRLTPAELRPFWEASGARAAVAEADHPLSALTTAVLPPALDGLRPLAAAEPADEGPALLLATSGTSGTPKVVRLSRRAVRAAVAAAVERSAAGPADRWLVCLPLDHIGGVSIVLRAMLAGYAMTYHQRFEATAVAADVAAGCTAVSVVPTMLHRLLRGPVGRWPAHLRCLLVGGGPLDPQLARDSAGRGVAPCQTYGLSECASQVCALAPAEAEEGLGTCGRPVRGMELRLAGDGTIQVRGSSLMDGYGGQPLAVDGDGWFSTGDLGRLDAHGRLVVLGRRDEVIVSGGEKIAPHEVEAALERLPGIREAAVYGQADAEWGEVVCAALVTEPGFSPGDLSAADLSGFKRPRRVRFLTALPRTASGKLQRWKLKNAEKTAEIEHL